LQIEYYDNKIERICTIAKEAEKKYGREMAEKIHLRIDQLNAAISVEMLLRFRVGRCHLLKGDRKNQYAMDLVHPYRLVFEANGKDISVVMIMEIVDYH